MSEDEYDGEDWQDSSDDKYDFDSDHDSEDDEDYDN